MKQVRVSHSALDAESPKDRCNYQEIAGQARNDGVTVELDSVPQ